MGVTVDDRLEQAQWLWGRAVFGGDADALAEADRQLSAVEADLAVARGRILHARFLDATSRTGADPKDVTAELALFERAVELYQSLGDVRGEAEAQLWIGTRSFGKTTQPRFPRSSEPAHSPPKRTIR